MASIRRRPHKDGTMTYTVLWREAGRQTSLTVYDLLEAEHVKAYVNLTGTAPPTTTDPGKVTVARVLLNHIDSLSGVEARTITGYRAIARDHISPHLGGIYVGTLTRGHVTRWINTLTQTPTKRTRRPASAKTIRNAHALLSAALGTAIDDGAIDRNVAKRIRLPARTTQPSAYLSRDDFELIYSHLDDTWQLFFAFLAGTGMRWGEAAALTVADVHRRTTSISITKAVKRRDGMPNTIGSPKTPRSNRVISIAPSLLADLLPLLVRPGRSQLFEGLTGKELSSRPAHHAWTRAAAAAELPTSTMKDLRSAHASWLLEDGVPPKVVQERLGHERISTTMEIYARISRDADAAAAAVLDGLGRAREQTYGAPTASRSMV